MELWKSAVIGLVQGLTEFLPVSSSAHIVFAERLLGVTETGLDVTIIVHLGTLLAVFAALWYRLAPVTKGTLVGVADLARGRSPWRNVNFRWGIYIIVGTIPAGLFGYLFEKPVENAFGSPSFASAMLLVTGGILFATRYVRTPARGMGWGSTLAVGFAQALAIFPGISRSGSTIATALYCKVDRQKAAEFSFLLAIPVILGGAVLWFFTAMGKPSSTGGAVLLTAMAVSAISGYVAIKVLLSFVQRGRLSWFAYYCWAVGLLGLFLFHHQEGPVMETASARSLRVMTCNVRFPSPSDEGNLWANRREIAAAMIREKNPDVIGLQEAYRAQLSDFMSSLPEYAVIGRERRGEADEEHCAILVRRGRFMIESSGTYWLSATPDVPGSRTWWPDDHPRIVTWATLNDLATARRLRVLNTHFPLSHDAPSRSEDEPSRSERGASVIVERLREEHLPDSMPIILTGDFNALPESGAHRLLTGKASDEREVRGAFEDAWNIAASRSGPTSTVHGFSGTPRREGARIDWILVQGPVEAKALEVVTFNRAGKYPSDHFPVAADLVIA